MKAKRYTDYKNPNKSCGYPFEPCPVGYCWSYARAFDKAKDKRELKKVMTFICPDCDCWNSVKRKTNAH